MITKTLKLIALLAIFAVPVLADDPRFPEGLYTVVFGITLGQDGELLDFNVSKVADALTGSTNAVDVAPSEAFVEKARMAVLARNYDPKIENGKPVEFYTYYYFDPMRPDSIDTDPS